ncbi:hypothetical protein PSN45_003676 [Yamadazyma tenuis]|uniref:Uncharacterized protein n=1 Tax=Candida tenuis (strain ATCC 10573 / BCRC 21748 / CBS 615 / JCM 9827 / NBRC 10315 / NRRL Y-1498 / VKM Y-70) TaxID=590646 RepID=G3B3N9_CANTC|nr:uncharacterized protein CANTEDRAFT_114264 [Yamadazyma tenuis ATCC 10573]EGV64196.1 hypothetical protein CANTEDRAFT_114264 [Yamadazyma tenuis ATCC 10573]WEJ96140.1 hypothetical protein PSN45_003676 [Yamadazyma tenuis]
MSTVTTKKKLVYKQDPDGVFRLKKLGDDDRLSTKSDKRTVDDYLNDLISCAYEVVEPNKVQPILSEDNVSLQSPTKSVKIQPQPSETHYDAQPSYPPQSPLPEPLASSATKENLTFKDRTNGLNITFPPSPQVGTSFSFPKMPVSTLNSSKMFHIPSFGLGLVIAITISQSSTYILSYSKIAFEYAKIGLVWVLILGAIAWYTGIIKVQEWSKLRTTLTSLTAKPSQEATSAPGTPISPTNILNHNHYFNQNQNQNQNREMHSHVHDYMGDSPPQASRSQSSRPRYKSRPSESRRNTATNIMPFKPHVRPEYASERSPSVPNLSHEKSSLPKLTRFNTSDNSKTNYWRFVERSRADNEPRHVKSFPKAAPLPSLPDEDLPFVNEVKLLSRKPGFDSFNEMEQVDDLPGFDIKRSNTSASKKSVLGTKQNYYKFLANADTLDHD